MQTIKTAFAVVLLLAIVYGIYVGLNTSEPELPPGLDGLVIDDPSGIQVPDVTLPGEDGLLSFPPAATDSTQGTSEGNNPSDTVSPLSNSDLLTSTSGNNSQPAATGTKPANSGTDSNSPLRDLQVPDLNKLPLPNANAPLGTTAGTTSNSSPPLPGLPTSGSTSGSTSGPSTLLPPSTLASTTSSSANSSNSTSATTSGPASTLLPLLNSNTTANASTTGNSSPSTTSNPSGTFVALSDTSSSSSGTPKPTTPSKNFEASRSDAMDMIDKGKLKEALELLTAHYGNKELTLEQDQDLLNLLDALAAEVIYSQRHFLESPYKVGAKETLSQISEKYQVPSDLIARINAVDNPDVLLPGTELKMIRGPFRAEVNLTSGVMTIFLDKLYAGQFPVTVGNEPSPKEGEFSVISKQNNRPYYGSTVGTIPANDPRNPYGQEWIELEQDMSIHGTAQRDSPATKGLGCISLAPRDAADVYIMLSRDSKVLIRR